MEKADQIRIGELQQFFNTYLLDHPYWAGHPHPKIRILHIPSNWLYKKGVATKTTFYTEEYQLDFRVDWVGIVATDTTTYCARIIEASRRGYDCYYFLNAVRGQQGEGREKFTNEDVEKVLYLPLDLDAMPYNWEFIQEEMGVEFAWCISTSHFYGAKKYQAVIPVDPSSEGDKEKWSELGLRLAVATGTDHIHDAKRVLRLPGTKNWKLGDEGVARGDECEAEFETNASWWSGRVYEYGELEEYVRKFESSEMAKELRTWRANKEAAAKGARKKTGEDTDSDSESGSGEVEDFGNYKSVLKAAQRGVASYARGHGVRHNALRTWAAQMAWEKLEPEIIEANIRMLAEGAFEGGCDDEKRDIEGIIRTTVGGYVEKVEKKEAYFDKVAEESDKERESEVAKFMEETVSDETVITVSGNRGGISGGAEDVEKISAAINRAMTVTEGREPQAQCDGTEEPESRCDSEPDDTLVEEKDAATDLGSGAEPIDRRRRTPTVDKDIGLFAHAVAHKMNHETEEQWFDWLINVGVMVNRAFRKDSGVYEPACRVFKKRLDELAMVRGCENGSGGLVIPEWRDRGDGKTFLKPRMLDRDERKAFLIEYVSAVAAQIYLKKKELGERSKDVLSGKKVKYYFPCKAGTLSALVSGIEGKIILSAPFPPQGDKEVVFQNGLFDLQTGEFFSDEGTGGKVRWFEQFRWLSPNPIACWFLPERLGANGVGFEASGVGEMGGEAAKWMPEFFDYLGDTFTGVENAATREELVPRIMGYSLIRGNPGQKFFAFLGVAGTGKGVFCEIVKGLVGHRNCCAVKYGSLADPWGFGPAEEKLVLVADEAEDTDRRVHDNVMSRIKAYTGGAQVALRRMHEDEREVDATAKIYIMANKELRATDSGGGIARRMVSLSFPNVVPGELRQDGLGEKIIREEGDCIATWATIKLSWAMRQPSMRNKSAMLFEMPGSAALNEGRERVKDMMDPLSAFLRVGVIERPGTKIASSVLCDLVGGLVTLRRMYRPGGQLSVALRGAMKAAGYDQERENTGQFYQNCVIDLNGLLAHYDVTVDVLRGAIGQGAYHGELGQIFGGDAVSGQTTLPMDTD